MDNRCLAENENVQLYVQMLCSHLHTLASDRQCRIGAMRLLLPNFVTSIRACMPVLLRFYYVCSSSRITAHDSPERSLVFYKPKRDVPPALRVLGFSRLYVKHRFR